MKSPTEALTPATGQPNANATSAAFPTSFPRYAFDEPDEFDRKQGIVGDSVTIHGTHLATVSSVLFNQTAVPSSQLKLGDDRQIGAVVPAGATTGRITVRGPLGSATTLQEFEVIQQPQLDSAEPSSAPAGTKIVLNGRHLDEAKSVDFNGTSAAFVERTERKLKVIVPSVPPGRYTITVHNRAGNGSIGFTVTP